MHLLWEFDYYCFFEGLTAELGRNFGPQERETHWHTGTDFYVCLFEMLQR